MTRLRPRESASSPSQGADNATANMGALTVRLTRNSEARNISLNSGNRGWVA